MVSNFSGVGHREEESKSTQQQPCLLITDGEKNCGIQTNMFNNKPELLYNVGGEIPEFLGRYIGCSFGEWVLLPGTGHDVLVNLFSKEIIELPPLEDFTYGFCILTAHPYDPTCHIVYFCKEENALMFCQPGDKEITITKWDYEFFPRGAYAVVAGKLFVFLRKPIVHSFTVGVIEFKESTHQLEVLEMDRGVSLCLENFFFFEYSGDFFVVYEISRCMCYSNVTGFEILKADLLNKKWVSVKSLGTLAIFIGYYGNYGIAAHVQCASVESGIKANSIYFLDPFDVNNYYMYNLEDGTVRMKPIYSSMEMKTTEDMRPYWIMMPCEASFRKLLKGNQESICHDSENENKTSGEEVGVQNTWNMVPPELLNLIQLHLFGRDNAVFRVVCKAWQQVSTQDYSTPSIPALLSPKTFLEPCQSSFPLLMFQEDRTISYDIVPIFRFFDTVHRKLYRTGIPELRETDIHYSKDGWLLVSRRRGDRSIFFFNPLTQEKIELPRLPPLDAYYYDKAYSLSFSSLPTCSNCLVVAIANCRMFYTLKHGEETWRAQEMGESQRIYVCSPVVLNGLHHFMCNNRDMVVFNLKDGVEGLPYCQSWPTKLAPFLESEEFFLEIDGGLAFVSVKLDGGQISIFKWNDLETDWELMEGGVDFGGKQMFLSRRGSFSEKIDNIGGMGNTIFLPMMDDAKEGVFYSPATHRYHTFYSSYSSELPYDVNKFLNGIWIKPDWKIVGDNNLKWFM